MYEVRLARDAQDVYEGAERPLQKKLDRCFAHLRSAPRSHPRAQPLRGRFAGYHRYRVGDWRVIYRIDDDADTVWIVLIKHRREAYR